MFQLTTASTVLFLGLVACGGGQPVPVDPSAEIETTEPEPAASEIAEPAAAAPEPEPAQPEPADPQPAEPAPEAEAPKPAPPKKACSEHKKTICQVTMGCVWHTQKKCIDGLPE